MNNFKPMTIDAGTHAKLKALAEREDRSMASIVRDAVSEYEARRAVMYVTPEELEAARAVVRAAEEAEWKRVRAAIEAERPD
jgi:predicted transcriptional regulator